MVESDISSAYQWEIIENANFKDFISKCIPFKNDKLFFSYLNIFNNKKFLSLKVWNTLKYNLENRRFN